ncbi:Hypothetical protein LUCI_1939 [Lucifera butyrica]|uniref:Uncharacterized protein n=1 Tax=Lucifera butyrica TaxID=1351585 RepID=A0A498R984_9FIRM|nr:Hypothetical protein LUCI_1939 [Lucifera butyrica]
MLWGQFFSKTLKENNKKLRMYFLEEYNVRGMGVLSWNRGGYE